MNNDTVTRPTNEVAQVRVSSTYADFGFIETNRKPDENHILSLVKQQAEAGNLTSIQPILVNERMQIIDGQHRFLAAVHDQLPVYYMQVSGLGIDQARSMNIHHRNWTNKDYAVSYALTDPNYQKFLKLAEDYDKFSYSIILIYCKNNDVRGVFKEFREGDFVMEDEEGVRKRLDKLEEVLSQCTYARDKTFAVAFLKISNLPVYNHRQMIRKFNQWGDMLLHRYASIQDWIRALEELYNYRNAENNRVRF